MKSVIGLLFIALVALSQAKPVPPQDANWVHLSTLWDAPGHIEDISSSGDFAVISNEDINRLINIFTGEVILEITDGYINFSSEGPYAFYGQYIDPHSETEQPIISNVLNLQTLDTYSIDGYIQYYKNREHYIVSGQSDSNPENITTRIHAINTGEIISEFDGDIISISHDLNLVAVHKFDDTERTVTIYDISSNNEIAHYTYPVPDYVFSISAAFNADDSLLAIDFFPNENQIISTDTWEVLYTLPGGIIFSHDGHFIAHNNHAGYSDVQLIEAHTGRIIDEFLGALYFSDNGQYWIRGEALDYERRHWQVIELETNEVVFEDTRYFGTPRVYSDSVVAMWHFENQMTQLYDLLTHELIYEYEGEATPYGDFVLTGTLHDKALRDWNTSQIVFSGNQIDMAPSGQLALVSTEDAIEVYILQKSND